VADRGAGRGEYWTEITKAFEAKYPNVRIKRQQIPFREFVDKMTVRFAGNNPPDIVHLPSRNFLAFASQGLARALDDVLAQTDVAGTYTKMSDEMRYEGKTYGVLMMAYGMMFYYNEKMLQDAKVAVPKTSDELVKGELRRPRTRRRDASGGARPPRASEPLSSRSARGSRAKAPASSRAANTTSPIPR
jgi:ABC-type glycerol-3-phosphate transport system substrate-binding protein